MDSPTAPKISDQEIAEVIDFIDALRGQEESREQGFALCRTVSSLTKSPKLSLHGVMVLVGSATPEDRALAETALQNIAEAWPGLRWVQFRCGYHFAELDQVEKGIVCYERSIALKSSVKAHFHVARLYKRLMQFESAIEHFERALEKNPQHPESRNELLFLMSMKGNLTRFGELEQGAGYTEAHLAKCYNRLGQTLMHQGKIQEAMIWYDKAVALVPGSFSYQWSKLLTVPMQYRDQDAVISSRRQYLAGLEKVTSLYQSLEKAQKDGAHTIAQKLTNFEIHYQSENDIEVQRPYGQLFHQIMSHSLPQFMNPLPRKHPGAGRRIRVGFASWGCFFTHSNYKTHGSWITDIDADRFEVFGYELSPHVDRTTAQMRQAIEHSIPFRGNAGSVRNRIANDKLDILVYPGIGMEPIVHCLAPLRLAPVQCTSWGHPVTSGLPNIDYYLSSDLMEPEDAQDRYTETLVRLPNLGVSQIAPGLPSELRPPEMIQSRPRPSTVFLCSQNILKMQPQQDFIFARILQTVPNSEVWFISSKRRDITDTFAQRMAKTCQSYGVDFAARCLMLPRLGKREFCWVNQHADVMLDTTFWSGCNTTFEALAYGTPVITLPGNTMRGRHTMAILRLHGLEELICQSEQAYVALAEKLASDSNYKQQIVDKIAAVKGGLFGDDAVIEALQNFFERSLKEDV